MQFAIGRQALMRLLRMASGVVDRKQTHLPVLSNVLLQVKSDYLSLTASDQELELVVGTPLTTMVQPGEITVPFRKLNDICRVLPDSASLSFKLDEARMQLQAGKSRFRLTTLPAEQFPATEPEPSATSINIPKKSLKTLFEQTAFAMAEQDVRHFLNGMLLEVKQNTLHAVAADGHRLAMQTISLPEATPPMRVIVPRKGILEFLRLLDDSEEQVQLLVGTNHIRLHDTNFTLSSKLLEGKFPDYQRVIPSAGDKVLLGARGSLKEAFHRAAVLFNERFKGVVLRLSESGVKVLAHNDAKDEIEEDLEVSYQGEALEIGFNVRYLIDFLSAMQSERVSFSFSGMADSARIEGLDGGDGIYVIMPMRI